MGSPASFWRAITTGRRRRRRQPVGRRGCAVAGRRRAVTGRVQRRRRPRARAVLARHEGLGSLWRPRDLEEVTMGVQGFAGVKRGLGRGMNGCAWRRLRQYMPTCKPVRSVE